MSVSALTWAFGLQNINPARKFLLVALANYADENNSCFPGQEKLAHDVGVSVSTIRRALKELEADGFVARERRQGADGYRTSDRYFLQVNMTANPKSDDSYRSPVDGENDSYRSNEGTLPVKTDHLTGHSYDRAEPKENLKKNRQRGTRVPSTLPAAFTVTEPMAAWAKEKTPSIEIQMETEKFKNYAESKGKTYSNWDAAWRNWMLNAVAYQQNNPAAVAAGKKEWW